MKNLGKNFGIIALFFIITTSMARTPTFEKIGAQNMGTIGIALKASLIVIGAVVIIITIFLTVVLARKEKKRKKEKNKD